MPPGFRHRDRRRTAPVPPKAARGRVPGAQGRRGVCGDATRAGAVPTRCDDVASRRVGPSTFHRHPMARPPDRGSAWAYHRAMNLADRSPGLAHPHGRARRRTAGRLSAGLVAAALALAACNSPTPSATPQATGTSAPTGTPSTVVPSPASSSMVASASTQAGASPAPVTSTGGDGLGAPTSEPAQSISVPVVSCPTTFGMPGDSMPPVPSGLTATVSDAVAAQVTFYGNGMLVLLGPRGWRCSAAVGVDGSSSMSITPPDQGIPSGTPPPDAQAITASTAGACVGCVATMACAIFPEAWNLFAQPGLTCPDTIPAGERITRPMPQSAVFEDPPGVAGTGDPSGGRYRALGFLVFDPGTDAGGSGLMAPSAIKVTCTLPDAMAQICDETVEGARHVPSDQ